MTRHHYVPQMYLKHFADDAKRIVLTDRDDLSNSATLTIKKALQLDDFYRWDTGLDPDEVEDPAVLDPEHIENLLSVFESRAAPVFQSIATDNRMPGSVEARYHLTTYLALQAARGQRLREDLSQAATLMMRRHMRADHNVEKTREWLARSGKPHEERDVAAFIERAYGPGGPRLVPDQATAIQQALAFAMQRLVPALWARSWDVLVFDEPSLLTSDEPIAAFHPDGEPVTAINAPVVLFALDRRHLLAMTQTTSAYADEPGLGGEEDATVVDRAGEGRPEQAAHFNSLVATQAERHVVCHPDDGHLLAALDLGPRTAWGEETLEVIENDDDTVTVRSRARRLPIQ